MSDRTDDRLERLARALRAEKPRPSPQAQARALAAALAAFDRHRQEMGQGEMGQGIGARARHSRWTPHGVMSWLWRPVMSLPRPYALAGGASLALLLGFAIHLYPFAPPAPGTPAESASESIEAPISAEALPAPPPQAEPDTAFTLSESVQALPQAETGMSVSALPQSFDLDGVASLSMAPGVADADPFLLDEPSPSYRDWGRDRFAAFDPNPVRLAAERPVSTFSIDVDTASYGFLRAALNRGVLPPPDAVRVEELVNYFPYGYAPPQDGERPFAIHVAAMPTPWNDATTLLRIAIQGRRLERAAAPRANLVFLIDSSGSMDAPDKLPLLIASFKLLLETLNDDDRVAIVTYAGAAGTVLPPTRAARRARILAALESLHAGGSTAGGEGLRQAYLLAQRHFVPDGINRVILATDGDFNLGISDPDQLEGYIARQREGGVFLSVLGFGMGNYNDALMQRLAQNGNGNAAYIDSLPEARKVLVEEATAMLFPIAEDVKVQVEFNPAMVAEYRLIGYETRLLAREDFANDKVDAGEIGAGHAVTALYELTPPDSPARLIEPLRYGQPQGEGRAFAGEIAFLKLRYKLPGAESGATIAHPVTAADLFESSAQAPENLRFAAAVAAFGQLLRGGRYTGAFDYDRVIALAQGARGDDPFGYRAEFVTLVRLAKSAAAMAPPP